MNQGFAILNEQTPYGFGFWVVEVIVGIVIPAVFFLSSRFNRRPVFLVVGALCAMIGIVANRWNVTVSGLTVPLAYSPGVLYQAAPGSYSPSLAEWGIAGHRRERLPGVWVGGDIPSKIASTGVRISQGVTTHGFALNVCLDLAPFAHIVPCGIADCRVTSMAALLGEAPEMGAVQERLAANFAERFHLAWAERIGPDRFLALSDASPTIAQGPPPPRATHQQGVT